MQDLLSVIRRLLDRPRLVLAFVAAAVAVLLVCPVPVLDEESYLDIAGQLTASRPYDWWRPWPPWGAGREADAFVYAHPPLFLWWVHVWSRLGGVVAATKVAAGLPWALLLGWGVGRLAERTTRRPWLAAAVWIACPITVLGLQRGLMPDLMLASLETIAVVAWVEAGQDGARRRTVWLVGGGIALSLAILTKYPAAVLVPVLLLHARFTEGGLRRTLPFWVAAAVPLLLVEGWLWWAYGRPHLWEVLSRAGEIPRGPLGGRALGSAVRLALGVTMLPLLVAPVRSLWLPAVAGAGVLVLFGAPEGTTAVEMAVLVAFAAAGLVAVLLAGRGAMSAGRREDVVPHDGLLMGGWAVAVVLAVVVGHNFSAPRYLLPAMGPLALLVTRAVERRGEGRTLLYAGAAVQGVLALLISTSEHHFFLAGDAVARQVAAATEEPGRFTGEWSFRWRLQHAGWTFLAGDAPPSGSWVAGPMESSPQALPESWVATETMAAGGLPLRVVDSANGVGLYGETIGALPLGWRSGPLEEAVLWRVP
jgi:4-amino-4-deoxy-L-arabinose transferase-like glycosyltransferase